MPPALIDDYRNANSRLFLLDYDGTLSPIKRLPTLAKPTPALLKLLDKLTSDPKNEVVIISGRAHEILEKWLGSLPLDFAAEHGALAREKGQAWRLLHERDSAWKQKVKRIIDEAASETSGSFLEAKTASFAWHYRAATNPKQARQAALKLIDRLKPIAKTEELAILDGNKVVDIKLASVDKGGVAGHWLVQRKWDFILAAGDDTTDEDLFKAMPPRAFTIKIGLGNSAARQRLNSPMSLRNLLKKLVVAQ